MKQGRCPGHPGQDHVLTRRAFLGGSTGVLVASSLLGGCATGWGRRTVVPRAGLACGPGSQYIPRIKAAFVRRKEEYGMWWPGAVYDGEAARSMYTTQLQETASGLDVELDLRSEPIYSPAEADTWVAQALAEEVDGLMVVLLDRQQHAWPTAHKAADSGLPTIVFSPLGSSFTTNTIRLAEQQGCVIYATDDFRQPAYGMKMLAARAKLERARCIVLRGGKRYDSRMADLGITLRHVPAQEFLDEYRGMPVSDEMLEMARSYARQARRQVGATDEDVLNGLKSYFVARSILEREEGDAITMDCLGTLANSEVSLPCIAWSRMNDDGIPAACEADHGAVASHMLVQYLFDRPGFQQDPVADTSDDCLIGAHCSSPTRLRGFDQPSEPFDLIHHHGNRDAVPRTLWQVGERITCLDVLPGDEQADRKAELLISTGTVTENIDVPPAGGCVVSVKAEFDGDQNVLTFPGFHQLFFYGDYGRELRAFGHLLGLETRIV